MRPVRSLGIMLCLLLATASSASAADPVVEILQEAKAICNGFENGVFDP